MIDAALSLRKAAPDDKAFAYEVRRAVFKPYVEQLAKWDEDEQRALHERRFRTQDFRLVKVDGTDIGIMAVVVTAECLKVNPRARAFYERLGFARTGETDMHHVLEWVPGGQHA